MVSVIEGPECKSCKQIVPIKCDDCGQNLPPKQVAVEKEIEVPVAKSQVDQEKAIEQVEEVKSEIVEVDKEELKPEKAVVEVPKTEEIVEEPKAKEELAKFSEDKKIEVVDEIPAEVLAAV